MSWQDLVRREGAVVDSLRQLPLLESASDQHSTVFLPNIGMGKMPPADWLGMLDRQNLADDTIFQHKFP